MIPSSSGTLGQSPQLRQPRLGDTGLLRVRKGCWHHVFYTVNGSTKNNGVGGRGTWFWMCSVLGMNNVYIKSKAELLIILRGQAFTLSYISLFSTYGSSRFVLPNLQGKAAAALCHPPNPPLPSGSRAVVLCRDWNSSVLSADTRLPVTGSCTVAFLSTLLATEQKI